MVPSEDHRVPLGGAAVKVNRTSEREAQQYTQLEALLLLQGFAPGRKREQVAGPWHVAADCN
jgi:hypothetical protein